jgi:hypothetical protein
LGEWVGLKKEASTGLVRSNMVETRWYGRDRVTVAETHRVTVLMN